MAKIFSQVSDQHSTVKEHKEEFVYTIHRCPVCWGRNGVDKPVCFIAVGLLEEGLKWLSGVHYPENAKAGTQVEIILDVTINRLK
jgi:predicted hydrocarbon binding protein